MAGGQLHIRSLQDLAAAVGVSCERLSDIVSDMHRHVIPVREVVHGKERVLIKPRARLKHIQRLIARRLLKNLPLHDSVHGYRTGHSPVTAATPHVGAACLLSLDIKQFFPHIRSRRVYDVWIGLGCCPDAARLLTKLTTYDCSLPLGFPTSPAIANLIRARIDARIAGLCAWNGLAYTNYSDNLYVSGPYISQSLADTIRQVVEDEGLPLPRSRVRLSGPGEEKTILGMKVSGRLNAPRRYRRRLRAEIAGSYAAAGPMSGERSRSILGKVNYVGRLNRGQGMTLERLALRHAEARLRRRDRRCSSEPLDAT